ncbi:type 2 lanthipeptide synthetase LanM [Pseudomonas sp. zfem004]|uniref:type 2 lanthipeptide synthetase LanM n=1 Tax=Pseudomonas sp. zfem004 TaxID=3078199 RepID=UPI002928EDE1|nr:type 2 lanthipeptide synthetase LanM [Pseudomonas sp. zfem004]MDU9405068.1 type 2 lanthipeptide synthetase LanM [Pseudomonas sp. zfem004]
MALFSANLKLLHPDDSNLQAYFGLNRSQLLERMRDELEMDGNNRLKPRKISFEGELQKLLNITLRTSPPCNASPFFWFEQRFYVYFRRTFIRHPDLLPVIEHLNLRRVLSSIRHYVINTVRRISEAALTHALNIGIQQHALSDLAGFSAALKDRSVIASLAANYPVLFDLLFQTLLDINAYLIRIVQHFMDDHEPLNDRFSDGLGKIERITLGLGDPHGHFQTVCEVNTTHRTLIYKPRNNNESAFYQATLSLLCNLTGSDWFQAHEPRSLLCSDHCWTEKVLHLRCQSATHYALFYHRLGAQIAVIHALNGIDFHFENIIAHGCSPVMIDLECLFTAPLGTAIDTTTTQASLKDALQTVRDSVFSSGFVPFAQHVGNDVSGLTPQCRFSIRVNTLVHENGFYHLRKTSTDHDAVVMHQPFAAGSDLSARHYLKELLEGFEFAYEAISQHKQKLAMHLDRHADGLTTRLLIKNTQRYVDFLAMSLHPRFLQSRMDRELLLATLWSEAKGNPLKEAAFRTEVDELRSLNIPRFTLQIGDASFRPSTNTDALLTLEQSPLQACRNKLLGFSPASRNLQRAVLVKCLAPGAVSDWPMNMAHNANQAFAMLPGEALLGAQAIAKRLQQLVIEGDDGGLRWLAFKTNHTTLKPYLTVMNNDLYSGMAGIGLFYLGLYRITANPAYLDTTDRIIRSVAQTQRHFDSDSNLSAFQGLGGYLYLIWHRKILAPTDAYDQQLSALTTALCAPPTESCESDLIAGSCGTLSLLSALHRHAPQAQLERAIRLRVQHICDALQPTANGALQNRDGSPTLSGLAHGISGAVLALCKAYEATQDNQIIARVEQYVRAENTLKQNGCWLDLRECRTSQSMSKWCHGDAGILLARQAVLSSMGERLSSAFLSEIQADIECCLDNIYNYGQGSGYGLCHGDFGNLMCLQAFYRAQGDIVALEKTHPWLGAVTRDFLANPAITEDSYPELGLMTGISGIGYCLLKQLDPALPDVLSLDFTASPLVADAH